MIYLLYCMYMGGFRLFFFFQAEDGIRDLVRSRGLGDVYKRQSKKCVAVFQGQKAGDLWKVDGIVVVTQSCKEAKLSLIHI